MKIKQLPYGVQDYMPEECYNKYEIEKKLSSVFYSYGYDRIEPSGIEYIETFSGTYDKKLIKIVDTDGSLLSLRSDPTMQISRIAATKLNNKNNRLYYIVNSYEFLMDSQSARTREFAQAGIELLGDGRDTEVVLIAVEALLKIGFKDFKIDIGQIDFFNGIIADTDITGEKRKELITLIDNKNTVGISDFAAANNIGAESCALLTELTDLFGGYEILERAKALSDNPLCVKAVHNLEEIMTAVKDNKMEKYVSIDLGLISDSYYTGIILRGYADGLGLNILDGGRYDKLSSRFGGGISAVGWALGIKRLLTALDIQGKLKPLPKIDYVYITDAQSAELCRKTVGDMRKHNLRLIQYYCNKEELKEIAEGFGAGMLVFSGNMVE